MAFNRKIYFIQEHMHEEFFHGGIGPADIERILLQEGATPLFFPCFDSFSIGAKWKRIRYLLKLLFTIERDAVVFFQYPLYARIHFLFLKLMWLFRPKVHIVCLTFEIDGLKYGRPELLSWEKRFFARYRYFIVHNPAMQAWFDEQVPGRTISLLGLFDLLTNPSTAGRTLEPTVAFAGNLSESSFQQQLHQVAAADDKLAFYLYGLPAMDGSQQSPQVIYKGAYPPYELPAHIEGAFGLVWDGDSIDALEGSFGHYMQFISHHKVSLYILAGQPLLVYEKAGTAAFIVAQGIGVTIKSLNDIPAVWQQITPEDYQRMRANMTPIATELARGGHLKRALGELLEKMEALKPHQR